MVKRPARPDGALSVEEAARVVGVSRNILHRRIADGELVVVVVSGQQCILEADLRAWVEAQRIDAPVVRAGQRPTDRLMAKLERGSAGRGTARRRATS